MHLKNKIIVITGASRGLGKALAAAFLQEGAKVIISAQNKKELKTAAKEVGATSFPADVTREQDVKNLAQFAVKKFGRIDGWVNNAGIGLPYSPIENIDTAKAKKAMEVNFFGTLYGSREALAAMKKKRGGTIVNIISVRALKAYSLSAAYSATKWAARGFTNALRDGAKPAGVSVIAIYPGGMRTEFFRAAGRVPAGWNNFMLPSYVADKIVKNLKRENPKEELIIDKAK